MRYVTRTFHSVMIRTATRMKKEEENNQIIIKTVNKRRIVTRARIIMKRAKRKKNNPYRHPHSNHNRMQTLRQLVILQSRRLDASVTQ